MKQSEPSFKEWKALYDAALEFRGIEPWGWMKETDIFGVQNPQSGEVGYCCIMGELGEVLAMAIYSGTQGLQGYINIQKGQIKPGDPDSLYIQDCLMLSFEDRRFIDKEDLQIIHELGFKFRGRNAWPLFRSYKPGYFPWFLHRDEVSYMTAALQQAKLVCLRLKDNKKLLSPPKKNLYLVRTPEKKDGMIVWKDEWREPAPLKQAKCSDVPVDEIRLQRIRKTAESTPMIWEVDFFYAPTPITKGERPYFPYAIMLIDCDSGFILDVHLAGVIEYEKEFIEQFLSCIENTSIVPLEILVRKEEAMNLLEPYASRLNINLSMVRELENIDHARREMEKHLGRS
jgi:hypothetical protein